MGWNRTTRRNPTLEACRVFTVIYVGWNRKNPTLEACGVFTVMDSLTIAVQCSFITWFVDEALYLFVQILCPLGQRVWPPVPESWQVVVLVTVQSLLHLAPVGDSSNGYGGDGVWYQRQNSWFCNGPNPDFHSSGMALLTCYVYFIWMWFVHWGCHQAYPWSHVICEYQIF